MLLQGAPVQTAACSYKCTNDWRFSFNNRINFPFVSQQTLQYAFRTPGIWNELPGIILCFGKVYSLLNGRVQAIFIYFFDNVFMWSQKDKIAKFGFRTASGWLAVKVQMNYKLERARKIRVKTLNMEWVAWDSFMFVKRLDIFKFIKWTSACIFYFIFFFLNNVFLLWSEKNKVA